jgi:hypothetical protein
MSPILDLLSSSSNEPSSTQELVLWYLILVGRGKVRNSILTRSFPYYKPKSSNTITEGILVIAAVGQINTTSNNRQSEIIIVIEKKFYFLLYWMSSNISSRPGI